MFKWNEQEVKIQTVIYNEYDFNNADDEMSFFHSGFSSKILLQ